jgi:hypothetical protein
MNNRSRSAAATFRKSRKVGKPLSILGAGNKRLKLGQTQGENTSIREGLGTDGHQNFSASQSLPPASLQRKDSP